MTHLLRGWNATQPKLRPLAVKWLGLLPTRVGD